MKSSNCSSCDESTAKTVFACSGAADLGHISDLVAREMSRNKFCQMKCLAFVSAGITDMINAVKETNMLVIDGCALDCGKKTFEENGLEEFHHLRLTDLGYEKGRTTPSSEILNDIYNEAISKY